MQASSEAEGPVAGNGLLHRRVLLAGMVSASAGLATRGAQAAPLEIEEWMRSPGLPFSRYGMPSKYEKAVERTLSGIPGTGLIASSRSPLHLLEGAITPNGLHYERHHSEIPDIDPDRHKLLIHGLVRQPLVFTLENLSRYPMETRVAYVECAGNSSRLYQDVPLDGGVTLIHGLVSASEWTGVKLSTLLDEAGVKPDAKWILAEGADASGFNRCFPLSKAFDDAMIALYQNGERVRPSNGYPMRLLLPGYEGSANVKWLRRLKLASEPLMTRDETAQYTISLKNGKALQFAFTLEVKSVITRPSPEITMGQPGLYQISGLAWSGRGKIAKVEVSADGGKSWAEAQLQEPILPKALTRFRAPWRWNGSPALLQSRATDETEQVQPTRDALISAYGKNTLYHCNAISTWRVSETGKLSNVYS